MILNLANMAFLAKITRTSVYFYVLSYAKWPRYYRPVAAAPCGQRLRTCRGLVLSESRLLVYNADRRLSLQGASAVVVAVPYLPTETHSFLVL